MKILLAEDEDRVSSFIKKGLEEQGHQVTQAFDGTTGLKLANQDDFDVISRTPRAFRPAYGPALRQEADALARGGAVRRPQVAGSLCVA